MPPAWTTPVDHVTGYVVTAADWDNFFGANGDLAYLYGDTTWTNMSGFSNSWTAAGSPNIPRYRLVGSQVTIQGAVTGGTVTTAIITLPAGYRPSQTVAFATSNGASTFAAISITSAGVISQTAGTNTNLHLSCTFSIL